MKKKTRRQSSSTEAQRYLRAVEQGRADDPVTRYALDVVRGRIVAGPWVRLAGERHLRDLERAEFTWDLEAARRIIRFFPAVLCLTDGDFEGKPFHLGPWQQFIVGSLFGWKRADGSRRFRTAFCVTGTGSGKSPFAAGIGHYMTVADGEKRAQVYAAAAKKDQARIIFNTAVAMMEQSPALRRRLQPSGKPPHTWNLLDLKSHSFFRPLSSDNKQSGGIVHCALVDEIHEHEDPNTVDMLRAGTKGRRQPLIFEITNTGFDRTTVCYDHYDYSLRVLQGMHVDESWFCYVCGLDEGDEWSDERVWLKANPNLGVSIQLDYLRGRVNEALGMPNIQNIVRRLNFCEWTDAESVGIPVDQWIAAAAPFDEAELAGRECFVGLDLSASQDLTAMMAYFPGDPGKKARVLRHYFIPGEDLAKRGKSDRVPYDLWESQGHLTVIPGKVIRFDIVEKAILDFAQRYTVREVAIDPFGGMHLSNQLADDGFTVVQMQQSYTLLSPPTKELLRLVAGEEIEHGGDPVLKWMAANVALEQNAAGDIRPSKKRSKGRIDGIVALVMAIDRASRHGMIPRSIYEDRHLYDQRPPEDPEVGDSGTGDSTPAPAQRQQLPAGAPPIAGEEAPRPRARKSIYDSEEWNQHGEDLTR
ncbi:MAG: terminase TerL endonuclease subunit [Thermoanaerobaculia bacterium]